MSIIGNSMSNPEHTIMRAWKEGGLSVSARVGGWGMKSAVSVMKV